MPRAAERPTRKPVKLPGPVVTAMRSSDANLMPDSFMTRDQLHQGFGVAALHRLRFLRDQLAGVGIQHAGGTGIERGIDGEDQHVGMLTLFTAKSPAFSPSWPGLTRPSTPFAPSRNVDARGKPGHDADITNALSAKSHRPDFDHVGHKMFEQVLDAVLQRRGG